MLEQEIVSIKTRVTLLFLVAVFVSSVIFFPLIIDFTLVPRFTALAFILAISTFYLYRKGYRFQINLDSILIVYFVYSFFCCATVFWSKSTSEAIFESAKQILSLSVFVLTFFALKSDRDYFISRLIIFSIIILLIEAVVVLYQLKFTPQLKADSLYAITGLNGHKNLFSSFLFLNLFFLTLAFFGFKKRKKIMAAVILVLNLSLLILLRTKAVWLGLFTTISFSLVVYALQLVRRKTKLKINGLVAIISICLLLNMFFLGIMQPIVQKSIHFTSQLNPSEKNSGLSIKLEEERLVLWDKTFQILHQNRVFGVGMGNWQIHFPDVTLTGLWRAEDLNYTFQRPHNDFLWILSETGLIGFNLFLLFLITLLVLSIKTIIHGRLNYELSLSVAFIIGYFVLSFFDFPKERIEHIVWINIVMGIAYYHVKLDSPDKPIYKVSISKFFLFLAFVLMVCITYTGVMRFKGEFYTRKLIDYKNSNQKLEMIKAGNKALSFAYSIDPTSVPINWYTGNAYASMGNYTKAQSDFLKAYAFNPYNRNVLNDLASSYVYSNNIDLAKKYYIEAARISPRFDDPKLNLAALYINEKNFKAAAFWLNSITHDSERRTNYQRIVDFQE